MNNGDIHIIHSAIVKKAIAFPTTAFVTVAEVSVAIVDAAIKSDRLVRPITVIKHEAAAAPRPVAGSPKKADFWSDDPSSGHPVVVVEIGVVGPETGRPEIAFTWANRLFINREVRWRERNRDADVDLCER